MPDPESWPALLAEAITLIREKLPEDGNVIEVAEILNDLMQRRGHDRYTANGHELRDRGEEYTLLAGEVGYLTASALQILHGSGEIREMEGGGGEHYPIRALFEHLGWDRQAANIRIAGRIAATPLRASMGRIPPTGEIRWPHVKRLIEQSIVALTTNLPVLAVVGARIAVEEAVRSAHLDTGSTAEKIEPVKAWRLEEMLFSDVLKSPRGFSPLDREATKSQLSAVRNAGNDAAHTGLADDAYQNELIIHSTPKALASLSAAVDAHL